ncbi:calcium-binding protein [Microvirga aerophila]|uniref:Peptidase M10 serralysin C-terminal domain-containing protein n=1 Tax=Microvirga aerophila TaxID=670291 RepID=A0A512BVW9_9HYPH|nr:calcium-binding protein [Microvirga aerophila]GEO16102.1 hypothetical protein MAE02_37980 [Microvirga aerophila]
MSGELLINSSAATDGSNPQTAPSVEEMADGRLAITWHDNGDKVSTNIVNVREAAVTVNGTAGNDVYAGSDYNGNVLNGHGGNDKFFGGSGTDAIDGGTGIDTVTYEKALAGITASLTANRGTVGDAAGDTYAGIENLTGSNFNDTLTGDRAANAIGGGAGNDKVYGGLGNDVLTGGAGKDIFVFDTRANKTTNRDVIEDFSVRDDSIYLENKYFTSFGSKGSATNPQKLDKDFFKVGTKAQEKDNYLIYNKKTGVLSYDRDGSGSAKAVDIAVLDKGLSLKYTDFCVI